MTQWTKEVDARLREYLFRPGYEIPKGIGTEKAACSVAAINLALSGELTDRIPDCMSRVVGRWIIKVQDTMPAAMRNSREWRELLPLAAGTGRDREQERLARILDWMWETVLPTVQPLADEHGYGDQWRTMCDQRTEAAARAAKAAAAWAGAAAERAAEAAEATAEAAAEAAAERAAEAWAAWAAAMAAMAAASEAAAAERAMAAAEAEAAAWAAAKAAQKAAAAARAAERAMAAAAAAERAAAAREEAAERAAMAAERAEAAGAAWEKFGPITVLERLVK